MRQDLRLGHVHHSSCSRSTLSQNVHDLPRSQQLLAWSGWDDMATLRSNWRSRGSGDFDANVWQFLDKPPNYLQHLSVSGVSLQVFKVGNFAVYCIIQQYHRRKNWQKQENQSHLRLLLHSWRVLMVSTQAMKVHFVIMKCHGDHRSWTAVASLYADKSYTISSNEVVVNFPVPDDGHV